MSINMNEEVLPWMNKSPKEMVQEILSCRGSEMIRIRYYQLWERLCGLCIFSKWEFLLYLISGILLFGTGEIFK